MDEHDPNFDPRIRADDDFGLIRALCHPALLVCMASTAAAIVWVIWSIA